MASTSRTSEPKADRRALGEEAFNRRLPEYLALAESDIVRANLDVTAAITTALAAVPKIEAARFSFVEQLRNPALTLISALEDHAWALHHAQGVYAIALRPRLCSRATLVEARALRTFLLRALQALATRGAVDPRRWKALHRGPGRAHLAMDLNVLAQVHNYYETHGSERERTLLDRGLAASRDIDRALELSRLILETTGRRRSSPEVIAAEKMRDRVFTMMWSAYDEACRCLTYVRWHCGDAHRLLPSLWHQQHRRKRGVSTEQPAVTGAVDSIGGAQSLGEMAQTPPTSSAQGRSVQAVDGDDSESGPFARN